MPQKSTMHHVRPAPALKAETAEALSGVGLYLSDAVRILLTRIVKERGLPVGLTCTEEEHDRWFKAKVQAALEDARSDLLSIVTYHKKGINPKFDALFMLIPFVPHPGDLPLFSPIALCRSNVKKMM